MFVGHPNEMPQIALYRDLVLSRVFWNGDVDSEASSMSVGVKDMSSDKITHMRTGTELWGNNNSEETR